MSEPTRPTKRIERLRAECGPGTILVFNEKHGMRYFDASTPELVGKAALKVLKNRLEEGWYGDESDYPYTPPPFEQSRAFIESLPEALRDEAKNKLYEWGRTDRENAEQRGFLAGCKLALSSGDGDMALFLIFNNREGEYEWVEFRKLERVDE